MKYLKTPVLLFAFVLLSVMSCAPYQNIEVSKTASGTDGPQTLVYCLPNTRIDFDVAVTRTIIKAGPYAAYAQKYLSLTGASLTDSEVYEISSVRINPVNEPDPGQFYAITYKNYPSNLDRLFSMTQQGLMLDLEKSWRPVSVAMPSKTRKSVMFENTVFDQTISENIDTLYKTILTDASFVKVPIYKKSMEIKKEEDKAEDMADLILKIRKRRLKLMMGEYDYQPEGEALKVIVKELNKQEEELMSNFIGKRIKETRHYKYSLIPNGSLSKELFWFSEQGGVSEASKSGFNGVSASVSMKENVAVAPEVKTAEKSQNVIYFRSPVVSDITVKIGSNVLAGAKIPVYQAGEIRQLPVMP